MGEFTLKAGENDDPVPAMTRFGVHIPNRELDDPIIDEAMLRQIAEAGRGQYVTIDQINELAKAVDAQTTELVEERSADLWNAPLAYLLFAFLITLEWITRKLCRLL
jgi:hypothetical protein